MGIENGQSLNTHNIVFFFDVYIIKRETLEKKKKKKNHGNLPKSLEEELRHGKKENAKKKS